jgi:hypothetical protein
VGTQEREPGGGFFTEDAKGYVKEGSGKKTAVFIGTGWEPGGGSFTGGFEKQ